MGHIDHLDYIDTIEKTEAISESDLVRLRALSKSLDNETRNRVAMVMALFECDASERILMHLIIDADELVRANACDSISFSENPNVIPVLIKRLRDRAELVRGYAVISVAEIAKRCGRSSDVVRVIKRRLLLETSRWVKTFYYHALYLLGNERYLCSILKQLDDNDYRIRICAVRTLEDIADDGNQCVIMNALAARYVQEDAESVRNALDNAIGAMAQSFK